MGLSRWWMQQQVPDTLDCQFEAVSQVAMADLLVLSKTDLVSRADQGHFNTRLRSLNPTADILRADRGVVPTAALWDLSGMRPQENSRSGHGMADATRTQFFIWSQ